MGLSTLISGQCLTATGKQKDANRCVIIGAIINFGLNMFLIPIYGALGAAIATVAAETVILVLFLYYSTEYVSILKLLKSLACYLVYALVMGVGVFGINCVIVENTVISLFLRIFIGGLIYLLLLIVTRDALLAEGIEICKQLKKK